MYNTIAINENVDFGSKVHISSIYIVEQNRKVVKCLDDRVVRGFSKGLRQSLR